MKHFISLEKKEQELYYEKASELMKISPLMVEKDFWVCWTLQQLFLTETLKDFITFKGGTSLSKAYNAIFRFSEDIDMSIEKSKFGFHDTFETIQSLSKTKQKTYANHISNACKNFVQKELLNILNDAFKKSLLKNTDWQLKLDTSDPQEQSIKFIYPSALKEIDSNYIAKSIKIEFGSRAEHWPCQQVNIVPYIKAVDPNFDTSKMIKIKTLSLERTFWEKATILHMFANYPKEKSLPIRQSRHYYDFYLLLKTQAHKIDFKNNSLLKRVCEHKNLYFPAKWADYLNAKENLKIIPEKNVLEFFSTDYKNMHEMIYKTPPIWEEIIDLLKIFEKNFNQDM